MAHTTSAKKELRKSKKRAVSNLRVQRTIKKLEKEIREKAATGDASGARALFPSYQKRIDKATKRGVKKNTAARKKSRLEAAIRKSEKTK